MPNSERDEKIDRLLHDAVRAQDGAAFALRMRDAVNARALAKKAHRLFAQAAALDPSKEAPAWAEVQS
jgi:hypothetical protein